MLIAWPGLVLCWCAAPLLVKHAVVVRARPHGGACCVVVCPPSLWGVLRWFVAPLVVERAVLVRGPPHGGACCVGACPPRRLCVVWFGGVWPGLSPSVGCVAVTVELLAWPGLVLCWCVPPPLLGHAVFVRGPPFGGACGVGVFGFLFVVL